jgi:hypothetical protein
MVYAFPGRIIDKEVRVVGGIYALKSGRVEFLG